MLLTLAALIGLHVQLEHQFTKQIHSFYLWTSTVQWGASLVYLALTLLTWRTQDRLWK